MIVTEEQVSNGWHFTTTEGMLYWHSIQY